MVLPAECLLDALTFLDYASLVLLKLTTAGLRRFCASNEGRLARRVFMVDVSDRYLVVTERSADGNISLLESQGVSDLEALYAKAAEVANKLDNHLLFSSSITFGKQPISVVELVGILPSLRWTSNLTLFEVTSDVSEKLLSILALFENLKRLHINTVPFDWKSLRMPVFLNLQFLALSRHRRAFDQMAMESELMRYCDEMTNFGDLGRQRTVQLNYRLSHGFLERMIGVN